jgi:hypothetical protein
MKKKPIKRWVYYFLSSLKKRTTTVLLFGTNIVILILLQYCWYCLVNIVSGFLFLQSNWVTVFLVFVTPTWHRIGGLNNPCIIYSSEVQKSNRVWLVSAELHSFQKS